MRNGVLEGVDGLESPQFEKALFLGEEVLFGGDGPGYFSGRLREMFLSLA